MKLAIINRGIVGSGKSTFAHTLQESAINAEVSCTVHNTDEYFMVGGEYLFDVTKLGMYHKMNLNAFIESMEKGIDIVVCDNTNTTRKEYRKYVDEAKKAGYSVIGMVFIPDLVEVHCGRNTHNVPEFVVENMVQKLNNNLKTEGVDHEVTFKPNKQGERFSERIINLVAKILILTERI